MSAELVYCHSCGKNVDALMVEEGVCWMCSDAEAEDED